MNYLEAMKDHKLAGTMVVDGGALSTYTSRGWVVVHSFSETTVHTTRDVVQCGYNSPQGWVPDKIAVTATKLQATRFVIARDEQSVLGDMQLKVESAEQQVRARDESLSRAVADAKQASETVAAYTKEAEMWRSRHDTALDKFKQLEGDMQGMKAENSKLRTENGKLRAAIGDIRYKQIVEEQVGPKATQ